VEPTTALLLYGTYSLIRWWASRNARPLSTASVAVPQTAAPDKVITLVGRTGAGKSSTANTLIGTEAFPVGAGHGSTRTVTEQPYLNGYRLRDTPGLLDEIDYSAYIWEAMKPSELVIYTTTGQLYRQELDIVSCIHQSQHQWDKESNTPGRRQLALYVNMQDVQELTMPSSVRRQEEETIRQQVAAWIPSQKIVFGAAAPMQAGVRGPARLEALRALIQTHMNHS
jgi:predicted GTPase